MVSRDCPQPSHKGTARHIHASCTMKNPFKQRPKAVWCILGFLLLVMVMTVFLTNSKQVSANGTYPLTDVKCSKLQTYTRTRRGMQGNGFWQFANNTAQQLTNSPCFVCVAMPVAVGKSSMISLKDKKSTWWNSQILFKWFLQWSIYVTAVLALVCPQTEDSQKFFAYVKGGAGRMTLILTNNTVFQVTLEGFSVSWLTENIETGPSIHCPSTSNHELHTTWWAWET